MQEILGIRYDEVGQVLTVDHAGRARTRYFDVPPTEWARLQAVFAKAAYLREVVRPQHRFVELLAA